MLETWRLTYGGDTSILDSLRSSGGEEGRGSQASGGEDAAGLELISPGADPMLTQHDCGTPLGEPARSPFHAVIGVCLLRRREGIQQALFSGAGLTLGTSAHPLPTQLALTTAPASSSDVWTVLLQPPHFSTCHKALRREKLRSNICSKPRIPQGLWMLAAGSQCRPPGDHRGWGQAPGEMPSCLMFSDFLLLKRVHIHPSAAAPFAGLGSPDMRGYWARG